MNLLCLLKLSRGNQIRRLSGKLKHGRFDNTDRLSLPCRVIFLTSGVNFSGEWIKIASIGCVIFKLSDVRKDGILFLKNVGFQLENHSIGISIDFDLHD